MISFLSDLIPKKTSNDSICRILREIWTEEDPEDSDEECIPNMKDDCRSLRIRSSKSELIVKHAGSLKAEVMTELLSASDDRSVNEDDEEDLPHKILRKIQNSLPELYENDNVVEDLIRLPKSALVKIFKSDRSCASEKMFFNILDRIAELESPVPKLNPISLCRMNKSSIDGTQNEYADIAINELEEEKLEEEEEDESEQKEEEEESEQEEEEEKEEPNKTSRKKKKIHFNETSIEFQSDMEEEEKSLKLETISERTQSVCREHSKR
mmetsp:Transcript_32429/g.31826  ORF Transcript_32429/g.31826 Transcript_32429/m.31826 type:complete len:268 (+) Transcript_32429:128-931(+)